MGRMFALSESSLVALAVPVLTGSMAIVGAWIERRHAQALKELRDENDEQHQRGYSLLQSIDARTIAIDQKVDRHGEWIARHEELHAHSN